MASNEPVVLGTYVTERAAGETFHVVVTPSAADAPATVTFLLNAGTGVILDPDGRALLRRR